MNPTAKTQRIASIDLLRGLVMIIMALDHVRDYFHADAYRYDPLDLTQTSVILFFTRWITHFCAPTFVFLSGISAFLSGQKKTRGEQARFLVTRGLWLVLLELTIINFSWTFNPFFQFQLLGVIWALGLAMICLAGALFLPKKVILALGILLVFGHNLLDNYHVEGYGGQALAWSILHDQKFFFYPHLNLMVGYPLLPWIGLMLIGYSMGPVFTKATAPERRKKILIQLGLGSLLLFVIIRFFNIYGDPKPWTAQSSPVYSLLSFLKFTKYPPSLDYLLVTVGGALLFLAFSEKASGRLAQAISIFGRVPMFYYLLHIYLIHILSLIAAVAQGHPWSDMTGFDTWIVYEKKLQGYGFPLLGVYGIWILVLFVLYPLCKKYDQFKSSNKQIWWLSYL